VDKSSDSCDHHDFVPTTWMSVTLTKPEDKSLLQELVLDDAAAAALARHFTLAIDPTQSACLGAVSKSRS